MLSRVLARQTHINPLSITSRIRFYSSSSNNSENTPPSVTNYKNKYHFNSLQFIKRLEDSGLSHTQAESILQALSQVLDETLEGFQNGLATKEIQGKMTYQQKVDFAKLKGELQSQERAEQTSIIHQQEHLNTEIEKLKQRLKEEIGKTQSSVRLDLNLEKGRVREESSVHELKIKETDTRIDSELANMKTQIENVKFQVMQWLITVCTGTFALVMAYIRMIS